jgi:hypothetical protein
LGANDRRRTAANSRGWEAWIDARIAAAIAAEHVMAVLAEALAEERHEIEGKIRDTKLQLTERMLDVLGCTKATVAPLAREPAEPRKDGTVDDLPGKWPPPRVVN